MSTITHSLESLLDEYIQSRHAAAAAEKVLDDAKAALMNAMVFLGEKAVDSPEHHLSVTRIVKRDLKIDNERQMEAALNEAGIVAPLTNPKIDAAKLRPIIEGMGGDVPGARIEESSYLKVTAGK